MNYRIYCDTIEDVQECIDSSDFMRPLLVSVCRRLLDSEEDQMIAELHTLDTYATINIIVNRCDLHKILHKILDAFETKQEYEECSSVKKLIDRIL